MKKLIGTVVLAALVAGAAFAELNVGAGFNRGLFVPIGYDGDAKTYQAVSWSGAPRIAVGFSGASDQAGFAVDLNFDSGNPSCGDNVAIWVKPVDWLKLQVGQWYDNTLRGSCGFGEDGWLHTSNHHADDLTFLRGGDFNNGVLIALTPIEGLYVGIDLYTPYSTADKTADVFKKSQYQVGYTIADIATIKAQYIGKGAYGIINAAVDLLMLEGQKISLGAFIPTDSKKNTASVLGLTGLEKKVGIAATYNGSFDALSLAGYVLFDMYNVPVYDFSFNVICVGVGLGYDLGDGLGLEADVRADLYLPEKSDTNTDLSFGVYLTKGLSNGSIGIGAQVAVPVGDYMETNLQCLTSGDKVHFALPIRVQVGF